MRRTVADRLDVSKSTVFSCIRRVGQVMMDIAPQFISWPGPARAVAIIEEFNKGQSGFPGVIGAIDGCHIEIVAPKKDHASFINRKGFHSVCLQAICDHELRFLHCYVGEPGSMHDSRVLRRSEVHEMLEKPELFPHDSHLIGDAAYAIGPHLLTPFRDNGHLGALERLYNKRFSKRRVAIERAFALLKNRFRRLYYVEMKRPDNIVLAVMTACVLHNVCLMWGDVLEEAPTVAQEEPENVATTPNDEHTRQLGEIKRQRIAHDLLATRTQCTSRTRDHVPFPHGLI